MEKYTVLTGAAGGLGRATAHKLAASGYNLIITDIFRPDDLLGDLQQYGGNYHAFELDVSDRRAISEVVQQVQELGPISGLVTLAGITGDRTIRKMTEEEFDAVIEINLKGTFLVIQAISTYMEQGGSIVTIGSVVSNFGNFGQANYVASKAGVQGITKVAAREFAKREIRVNCILPGFIRTPMALKVPEDMLEAIIEQIPMGRMGQPDEIASVIEFLLSDRSSYLTGASINVNGGLWMG